MSESNRESLRPIVRDIATALGHQFTMREGEDIQGWNLAGAHGAVLWIRYVDNHRYRIEISGRYPDDTDKYIYNLIRSRITVATNRRPSIMAAEITRKILPTYLKELARVQASLADHRDYVKRTHRLADEIADVFGVTLRPEDKRSDGRVSFGVGAGAVYYGDVSVYGDSVSMDLHSLPADVARAIGGIIRSTTAANQRKGQ